MGAALPTQRPEVSAVFFRKEGDVLGQTVGRTFQGTCDAALGDARCGVDLEDPAFKGTGAVIDLLRDRAFTASGLGGFASGWFTFGTLDWTSGANAGRRTEVLGHDVTDGIAVLTLLEAPGNDAISCTALAAAGATVILFTTGRGTPLGFPVPTMKISSNTPLAERKSGWIDFNAGQVLETDNKQAIIDAFLDHIVATASGEQTCSEKKGERSIAIWKKGVTL